MLGWFLPSPEIIHFFSSGNRFVCVMLMSWYLLSPFLIPLSFVYSRGTGYLPHGLLWPHHRGQCTVAMSQELKRQTCYMRSHSHERLWPPLLKLVSAVVAVAKKINSGFQFQFQFQFQGFQFQFHFQFHQFQFQFQFQFRNWNWAAIPIPELNWPQPCSQWPTLLPSIPVAMDLANCNQCCWWEPVMVQ